MNEDDGWMTASHSWNLAFRSEERVMSNDNVSCSFHSYVRHEAHVSEIQLREIVDEMAGEASSQGTDGDEIKIKNE
jgi:hypothetical protein